MSGEQFFACIGEIEDRFIAEAEAYHKSARKAFPFRRSAAVGRTLRGGGVKKSLHPLRWIPAAACLALLAVGGFRFLQLKGGISSGNSSNGAAGGTAGADSGRQVASSAYLVQEAEDCDEEDADGCYKENANADAPEAPEAPGIGAAPTDGGAARQDGAAGGAHSDELPEGKNASPAVFQYPSKCIRTNGYVEGQEYPYTVVIRSEAELVEYVSANEETYNFAQVEDSSESFYEAVEAYDAAYFESSALVFAVLEEGSCSVRYQVEGITAENEIVVERLDPDDKDDGLAEWHIILEIPADSPTLQSEQPFIVEEFEEQGDK